MSYRLTAGLMLAVFAACSQAKPDERAPRSDTTPNAISSEPVNDESPEFNLARRRREHWAWQPVRVTAPPPVRDPTWASDPIDRFILAGLEKAEVAPALPAERRTLIRRAYFDLIGLPPAPHEVEAFVADDTPDAFERVVDRLLASPQFGERWSRHWLDLVRYAETRGHEFDPVIPNAFQYRDYLIRALNADLPYDQFVTEHIAGDLLQKPRLHGTDGFNESILGTGFWCLGEELHSPVDIRGDETDRIDNKIDVFSKAFLGLTVACARCHDHKFDAISMRDYYALAGFLLSSSYRQVPFEVMERNQSIANELELLRVRFQPAVCQAVAAAAQPAVARVNQYLLAAQRAIQLNEQGRSHNCDAVYCAIAADSHLDVEQLRYWIDAIEKAREDRQDPLHLWSLASRAATGNDDDQFRTIVREFVADNERQAAQVAASWSDAQIIVNYSTPNADDWSQDGVAFGIRPVRAGDMKFSTDPARPIAEVFRFGAVRSDPSWDVVRLSQETERDPGKVSWPQSGRMMRTRTFALSGGKVFYLVRGAGHAYAAVDSHRMIAGPLHGAITQSWDAEPSDKIRWVEHDLSSYIGHRVHIEFSPKQADPSNLDGRSELAVLAVIEADRAPCDPVSPNVAFCRKLAEFGLASPHALAQAYEEILSQSLDSFSADRIVGSPDADCTAWLITWLIQHPTLFLPDEDEQSAQIASKVQPFFEQCATVKASFCAVSHAAPALLDGSGVDEYLLPRGNHRNPGAAVPRRFLEALQSVEEGVARRATNAVDPLGARSDTLADGAKFPAEYDVRGSGRLDLARSMTNPNDPLVARVMVNRVWHYLFGRGIVASVDNFGALGDRPTHPELLDYLAERFIAQGWSVKRLIRQIVLSSTYQMSAQPQLGAASVDPQNILLHRMPVRRLEGEVIRDAILTISDRLDTKMFGPSIELRLTPFMEGRGRPATSGALDGDGRRSIYLRVRRNFLHPMFMAFDAPTPCTTIGRRSVSNVPAQALSLMNNEFVIAEAKRWAHRIIREIGSPEDRVRQMFLVAFGRSSTTDELTDTLQFISDQQDRYRGAGDENARVWEDLAHILLNAKEFIFIQ